MVKMFNFIKKLFEPKQNKNNKNGLLSSKDLFLLEQDESQTPWAIFEIVNFDEDGKVKVEFNWNQAFIKKLDEVGFTAETEEDTVQLFFYASQMQPEELSEVSGDESVQIADLPNLSQNVNRIVK
jgi:hypothetical protein